jgi:hypothetical protein
MAGLLKLYNPRWFKGSMRECFWGELSPLGRGEGVEGRVKMRPAQSIVNRLLTVTARLC